MAAVKYIVDRSQGFEIAKGGGDDPEIENQI